MRRWIAIAALGALSCAALTSTASCGSQQSTDAGGNAAGAEGGGSGDATTGGGDSRSDDAPQGDDSPLGFLDSAGGDDGTGTADAGSADSAGGGGDGACVPAAGCPSTYHCGRYVDPCTGNAYVCGSPCTGGQVCASGGGDSQVCQPKSCVNRCGIVAVDGCGVPISCGGCMANQACINNTCVPQTSTDAGGGTCAPLTCTPDSTTHLCGTVADPCGNTLRCSCPSGEQCIAGVCSPPPPECGNSDAGFKCGNVQNACGSGSVQCSGCPTGTQCTSGTCTPCPAPSCGAAACGTASNGCGTTINCGTGCGSTQVCTGGACCTPSTCAQELEAGTVTGCGTVDLGCGVHRQCTGCDGGEVCSVNACVACVPKTCSDYGNTGCGHQVGCGTGQTLDCCAAGTTCMGTICCPAGQTNMNGICCPAGQVNYNGSCCMPSCDPQLPPGAQVSCGVTIYCAG